MEHWIERPIARACFGAAAALVALAGQAERAEACSCARPTMTRKLVTPAAGAPTNSVVRVFLRGGFPVGLRRGLVAEYRLRDPRGRIIALAGKVAGTRLDMRPARGTLAPRTRYILEQVFAFDDSGARLTDTERMRVARFGRLQRIGPTSMRRAWFPVARFTTGAGALARRPPVPHISRGNVSFRYGGGDCGPAVSLIAHVAVPLGVRPGDSLELEVKGHGVVNTIPLGRGAAGTTLQLYVSNTRCNPDKVSLGAAGPYKARVAIRSMTGARSALSAWFQPHVARRKRPLRPLWSGQPAHRAAVRAWLGARLVKARGRKPRGPAGCRGGLVVARRFKLTSSGAPDSYEAVGSVAWSRGQGWTLSGNAGRVGSNVVLFGKKPATRRLAGSGWNAVGARDRRGSVVATVRLRPRLSRVMVAAYSASGKQRWAVGVGGAAAQSRPRLALGARRVLVTWRSSASITNNTIRWALLDRATGKLVADDGRRPGAGPRVGVDVHYGVARSAGRFFVVYTGERPSRQQPRVIVISARTGKRLAHVRLPLHGAGNGFALAPAPRGGVALAYARRGQIFWQLLDKNARARGRSVHLSQAVGSRNRKPRIARAGALWAVGWEVYPGNMTHVAVVDAKGRHSSTALAAGMRTSTVALASTGMKRSPFVARYVERYGKARAALLRCSRTAPLGPPPRIAVKP